MGEVYVVMMVSWLAGMAAFAGGVVARFEGSADTEAKREIMHGIIAFGGGILVAAVAFALLPHGLAVLSPAVLGITFCAGGVFFCVLDILLDKHGGAKAQFVAMLSDFFPEAIALGAVFGSDHRLGLLLAGFIGAQNLPEGFNSYREITRAGVRSRTALAVLLGASLLGPLAAVTGYFFLQEWDRLTAAIMVFAGGGILYLIFQDIAPQSKLRRRWLPALGAVLGFAVGLLGKKLIG
jgi:ZIP family zinc transporter